MTLLRQTAVCLGGGRSLANPQGRERAAPGDVPLPLAPPHPALRVGVGPRQAVQGVTKVTHIAGSGGDRKLGSGGDSCRGEISRMDGKGLVLPGNGCPCPGSKVTG